MTALKAFSLFRNVDRRRRYVEELNKILVARGQKPELGINIENWQDFFALVLKYLPLLLQILVLI
jgi:hypothetical protein